MFRVTPYESEDMVQEAVTIHVSVRYLLRLPCVRYPHNVPILEYFAERLSLSRHCHRNVGGVRRPFS
jgi:hypothetical protein